MDYYKELPKTLKWLDNTISFSNLGKFINYCNQYLFYDDYTISQR